MKGEKLLDLCLGIWPDTVELLERHGYEIIPRYRDEEGHERHKVCGGLYRCAQALSMRLTL